MFSFFSFCWGNLLKKPRLRRLESNQDEIGRTVLQVLIDWVGFGFDITLSRWRPRHHFTRKSAAT